MTLRAARVAIPWMMVTLALGSFAAAAGARPARRATVSATDSAVQHLVVIYQENVSYDHYFGTYPSAANPVGESSFRAAPDTPSSDNYLRDPALLTDNPNGSNPQRLDPQVVNQLLTCDQNHDYGPEQQAFDHGRMDQFVSSVGTGSGSDPTGVPCQSSQVMDYYDGNSVTALWNYAQHFTMSDNSYGTTFGPSTPGALNLVAGNTAGVSADNGKDLTGEVENSTVIGDPQPLGDDCTTRDAVRLSGRNIGDLLNDHSVTWGFFEGGFGGYDSTTQKATNCKATHNIGAALGGTGKTGAHPWGVKVDYIPHHEPFQYYASTENPHHMPPSSVAMIGHSDQANHQYDLTDFWAAVANGNMPAVSFLKAAGYEDGHAAYSDPIDEQQFLVSTINRLEATPEWAHTLVVIAYDDSDGWYDHAYGGIDSRSAAASDSLTGDGQCGGNHPTATQDRCGPGPRLPLLLISPWVDANSIDHHRTNQTSILRFIEDNWQVGRIGGGSFDSTAPPLLTNTEMNPAGDTPALVLDPATGQPS
jgi:phospholipase C